MTVKSFRSSALQNIQYGILDDEETVAPYRLDPVSHNTEVITHQHHEVHEGSVYRYADAISLDNGISQDYLFTTPNTTKWAHLTFQMDGSANTSFFLYEGANRIGTTLQTTFNANRNSSNLATCTVHKSHSGGSTDGVLLLPFASGSGAGLASRSPAGLHHDEEWTLKQNTKYIFRITSGTNTNLCNIILSWYEHTNKS